MKKILSRVVLGCLCLSLSCTGGEKNKEDKPPQAPTCLSASLESVGSTIQIKLSWADPDSVNEFNIERSYRDQSNFSLIAWVGGGVTEYHDQSIEPGTTYWYRVQAENEAGLSGYCEPVSATTLPQAPINLSASPESMTQIKLSWADSYPGTSDGFRIEESIHDQQDYHEIASVGKGVAEYHDQGLEPGMTYWYRVLAYNQGGDSDYSEAASATTIFDGYSMCVVRENAQYFNCLQARCGKENGSSDYFTVTGTEVFDCLGLQLTAPTTMTITFTYSASASSCYIQPYLEVIAGTQSQSYPFDCNASGNSSISIAISGGLTVADISFGLSAGDWGSSVRIESITFTP